MTKLNFKNSYDVSDVITIASPNKTSTKLRTIFSNLVSPIKISGYASVHSSQNENWFSIVSAIFFESVKKRNYILSVTPQRRSLSHTPFQRFQAS